MVSTRSYSCTHGRQSPGWTGGSVQTMAINCLGTWSGKKTECGGSSVFISDSRSIELKVSTDPYGTPGL